MQRFSSLAVNCQTPSLWYLNLAPLKRPLKSLHVLRMSWWWTLPAATLVLPRILLLLNDLSQVRRSSKTQTTAFISGKWTQNLGQAKRWQMPRRQPLWNVRELKLHRLSRLRLCVAPTVSSLCHGRPKGSLSQAAPIIRWRCSTWRDNKCRQACSPTIRWPPPSTLTSPAITSLCLQVTKMALCACTI